MAKQQKFYVVWKGREPGIFQSWSDCQQQIAGYSGAQYKAFASRQAAAAAFAGSYEQFAAQGAKGKLKAAQLTSAELEQQGVILDSLCVDAACSGNPGVLQYQGVETDTGLQLFHQGPFPEGTVNLGEFLALVHALAHLQREGRDCPVYSDSQTAIGWVLKRHVNTKLPRRAINRPLFELVERGLRWLAQNPYPNKILKWETARWGEIRADFGRK